MEVWIRRVCHVYFQPSHDYSIKVCGEPCSHHWSETPVIAQARLANNGSMELANAIRDLALFNIAIDNKLRSCDLAKLKVAAVYASGTIKVNIPRHSPIPPT